MTQPKQHLYSDELADWQGYTLEEIRYARAYTAARMVISRERLTSRLHSVGEKGVLGGSPTGLIGKLLGAFSYIDIALLAWKFGSRIFKFTRALRR